MASLSQAMMPIEPTVYGPKPTLGRLQSLLEKHQRIVDALTVTLELLRGEHAREKQPRVPAVMRAALAMERARQQHRKLPTAATGGRRAKTTTPRSALAIREQRKRTAVMLKRFSTTVPRRIPGTAREGLGTLKRHGYLVATPEGFLRTAKPFVVGEIRPERNGHGAHA